MLRKLGPAVICFVDAEPVVTSFEIVMWMCVQARVGAPDVGSGP